MTVNDVLWSAWSVLKEKCGHLSKSEMSKETLTFGENENDQNETGKKGVMKFNDDKIPACPDERGKNHKNMNGRKATQSFSAPESPASKPLSLNPAFSKEVDHGSNVSSNGADISSSTKSFYISECVLIVSIMKEIAEGLLVSVDLVEKFLKNPNDKSAKEISTLFAKISDENVDVNTEIRNSSNSKSSQIKKFEKDDDFTALLTSGSEANETLEARLDRLNSENNRLNHKISELEERHNAIMIELFQATEKVKECKHVFIDNPGIINDGKRLGYPNYKNCKYSTNCSNEDLKDVPKVVISTNDMNEYFDENQELNYNKNKSEEKRPVEVKNLVISDKRKRNVEMKPEGNIENDTMNDEGMRNNEDRQERNDNEEMMRSSDMPPFTEEEVLPFSVQQDESNNYENISLKSAPPISVASSLFVNYKMMLLTIPERLLSSDVTAMKEWARRQFSIEHAQDATEILHQLDRRLIISASNLSVLHLFFESIIRFDLIYIIDGYLTGDYSVFKKRSANEKPRRENHGTRSSYKSLLMSTNDRLSLQYSSTASKPMPKRNNDVSSHRSIQRPSNPLSPVNINVSNPVAKHPHENQSEDFLTQRPNSSITTNTIVYEAHVMNTSFNNASNPLRSSGLPKGTQFPGSNGKKHSKLNNNSQNSEVAFTSREGNWLCSHYKRHCFVKFDCCEQFYPCHRCHNNQSACGNKKLKSRDVKKVKCAYCSKEQEFGEKCTNCGVKFAEYFCALCKHLTGKDDHPYHCEKCGICRVHGDRSFHCDVCGVCLDVQLRGNHKCRENSAHDECCICLEDAFTGCQILPCSHKVHKECANEMIRRGITRCPICRESFAHKLEKKTPSKRRHGGRHK